MTANFEISLVPPQHAIADGASTPDPGKVGSYAWSTTLSKLVYWDGSAWHPVGGGAQVSGALPVLPVYEGEARPDPGTPGSMIWSSVAQRALVWNGKTWHATKDGLPITGTINGLRLTPTDYYKIEGGEKGDAAGWGLIVTWKQYQRGTLSISTLDAVAKKGYEFSIYPENSSVSYNTLGKLSVYNAAGTLISSFFDIPAFTFDQLHAVAFQITATELRTFTYGMLQYATSLNGTAYAPGTNPVTITSTVGTFGELLGMLAWRGIASDAAVVQALRDIRDASIGDLSGIAVAGGTLSHRHQFGPLILTEAGTAPQNITDTITYADSDVMKRYGSPIVYPVVASTEGATTYGLLYTGTLTAYTCSSSFSRPRGIRPTSSAGMSLGFDMRSPTYSNSKACTLVRQRQTATSQNGWEALVTSSNQFWFSMYNNYLPNFYVDRWPTSLRCTLLITRILGTSTWKIFLDGVEFIAVTQGSFLAIPDDIAMELFVGEGGSSLYGFTGGAFSLTDTQAKDWARRTALAGRIQPLLVDTANDEHTYDIAADIAASGPGNGGPARILDRSGDDHFTRNEASTLQIVTTDVRHSWAYEKTPVYYGLTGCSAANYYQSAAGAAPGKTTGFWLLLWAVFMDLSLNEMLFSATGSANTGFYVTKNASLIRAYLYNTSNAAVSAGLVGLSAQAIGIPQLFLLYFNGTHMRFLSPKAQNTASVGTAFSTYAPSVSQVARIGAATLTAGPTYATNAKILGVAYGETALTYGDIYTQPDRMEAANGMVAIPGKTLWYVDYSADYRAAAGTPASLVDRQAGAWSFAKVGAPVSGEYYGRSWAR